MRIVCTSGVLFGREAFSTLGEVTIVPDRRAQAEAVRDADALIVRSQTRVDRALLAGSRVRFVGTATAGFDHLDTRWLQEAGIAWAAATGCNANSVAEYVVAALLELAARHTLRLEGMALAVIGVGQVGRQVVHKADALGMRVLQNDPPRRLAEEDAGLRELAAILPEADIVSLHVPLTDTGPFATRRLVDAGFLARCKAGAWLINTARGEVVDEQALRRALDQGRLAGAVLDVWAHEPQLDAALCARAELTTPHIAGHSFDGKLKGTLMMHEAACRFFACAPNWDPDPLVLPPAVSRMAFDAREWDDEALLREAVRRSYDIAADDRALRAGCTLTPAARGALFDTLRRDYPIRREFFNTTLAVHNASPRLLAKIRGIGFRTAL